MSADLERELRERLQRAGLPVAPDRLRASLEAVAQTPVDRQRPGRRGSVRLLAVAALIATGGLAEMFAPLCTTFEAVDPYLTLHGLAMAYDLVS